MKSLLCSRCGENLREEGGLLKCPYCGATYEKESAEEAAFHMEEVLGQAKIELVANRKRHLWDVAHEKYPSKEKVVEAANAVLSISAEDFLARIYLHSHDRDPLKLNVILSESNVSSAEANEVFRWLLPSLSRRTIGPLHDFVDRHFSDRDRFEKISQIEAEASKISQGIYEPGLPRDVFLCYSSQDMAKVVSLLDLLEQNGFACFAAFRNLRHGKGAQEDYLSAIKTAMRSCEVLVFVSSEASRSIDCDALRVELPYLIQELPNKPRVEFVIEDYGETPFMVKRTLKKAFPSQEYCRDEEDLMVRIQSALEGGASNKNEGSIHEAKPIQTIDEETIRKEAEEKVRKELLREKLEKEARERLLATQDTEKEKAPNGVEEKPEIPKETKKEPSEKHFNADHGVTPTLSGDGKTLTYGLYPQDRVSDSTLLSSLNALGDSAKGANGWYLYDGEYYAKASAKPYSSDYKFDDGATIVSGTTYWFKCEPIKWRILAREGDRALVVSDRLLDAHCYCNSASERTIGGKTVYGNNYEHSDLREWLNGDFYGSAFALGDSAIQTTEVDNSAATTGNSSNTYACANTKDKVSLPSYKDYLNSSYGFSTSVLSDPTRQCRTTDWARARGAWCSTSSSTLYNGYYWTRSPYSDCSNIAWGVRYDGGLGNRIDYVDDGNLGVRPGLSVRIA